MVSLKPDERGNLLEYLQYFKTYFDDRLYQLLVFLNYAFRKSEFFHPDIKLGLIKILGEYICNLAVGLSGDEIMQEVAKGLVFKKYFPYQISQVSIMYQFKAIYQNSPLRKLYED